MKRYMFNAYVLDDGGNRVYDRWRFKAGSFEEACEIAQYRQTEYELENGYEPELYTRFELLEEVDV